MLIARTPYTVYGFGTQSCGRWTQERRSADQYVKLTRAGLESWAMGFISGAGYAGETMRNSDADAMLAWMDNYCAANPLDYVSTAAEHLIQELRVRNY